MLVTVDANSAIGAGRENKLEFRAKIGVLRDAHQIQSSQTVSSTSVNTGEQDGLSIRSSCVQVEATCRAEGWPLYFFDWV